LITFIDCLGVTVVVVVVVASLPLVEAIHVVVRAVQHTDHVGSAQHDNSSPPRPVDQVDVSASSMAMLIFCVDFGRHDDGN
jgi:hypothetical protein